jgi:hypothetical protein
MPPQQGKTLLDLVRDMRHLGSHHDLRLPAKWAALCSTAAAAR